MLLRVNQLYFFIYCQNALAVVWLHRDVERACVAVLLLVCSLLTSDFFCIECKLQAFDALIVRYCNVILYCIWGSQCPINKSDQETDTLSNKRV